MMTALLAPSYSTYLFALQPPPPRPRHAPLRLQEPPFPLPYEVPEQEKPFADYVWDPDFPGTFKPGTRGENYDLDVVLEMWKDKENPACMELPQDELWQVPLAPPEDILSWLGRIGLLEEEEAEEEEEISSRGDSLLDDEFDLDDDSQLLGDVAQEAGIESENSLE